MRDGLRWSVVVTVAVLGWAAVAGEAQGAAAGQRVPVLVELFTSEGCSSCPPADALLRQLGERQPVAGVEIVVLSEHVDYWDQLGWHDRFSSPLLTARQQRYAPRFGSEGPYTPQMVVDGRDGFVGSDGLRALAAIRQAAKTAKLPLVVSTPAIESRVVTAVASLGESAGAATTTKASGAEVYAALVDPEDRTEVRRGENGGRTLTHVGVVRVLQRLGTVGEMMRRPLRLHLMAPDGTDPATMQVVLFIQEAGGGGILGAATKDVRAPAALAQRKKDLRGGENGL